jgi:hypothetical protein
MSNRILKSSIADSETIQALHNPEPFWFAEVLWTRIMVCCCDDYGRFDARPTVVRSLCFPLMHEDEVTGAPHPVPLSQIESALNKMAEPVRKGQVTDPGLITLYDAVDEKGTMCHCGAMNKWSNHQRDRNTIPKHPAPVIDNLSTGSPQLAANGGDSPLARARQRASGVRSLGSGVRSQEREEGVQGKHPVRPAMKLVGRLCASVRENSKSQKVSRAKGSELRSILERWATELERIMRSEKWSYEQVRDIIAFVRRDNVPGEAKPGHKRGFCWAGVVLSPTKLRNPYLWSQFDAAKKTDSLWDYGSRR